MRRRELSVNRRRMRVKGKFLGVVGRTGYWVRGNLVTIKGLSEPGGLVKKEVMIRK